MTVVCAGEMMAAFRSRGPLRLGGPAHLSVAGAEANVAIGLTRLGVPSAWIGVVGDDELGALVRRTLTAEGVACTARVDPSRPTGVVVFEPAAGLRTRAAYYRRDSAGSTLGPGDVELGLNGAAVDAVLTSGITAALSDASAAAARRLLEEGRRRGSLTCLSVNYRSALWSRETAASALPGLVALADLVIASASELGLAAGVPGPASDDAGLDEMAETILRAGPWEVVVTKGGAGASAYTAEGRVDQAALEVPVVDTIGAGDAFTAGYLSARLEGRPIAERLSTGAAAAAFCIGVSGDWEGLPTRRDLKLVEIEVGDALR